MLIGTNFPNNPKLHDVFIKTEQDGTETLYIKRIDEWFRVVSTGELSSILGSGGIKVPSGTTAQRINENGRIRLNTDLNVYEGFVNGTWHILTRAQPLVLNDGLPAYVEPVSDTLVSIETERFVFCAKVNNTKNIYLSIEGDIVSNVCGYILPRNAILAGVTLSIREAIGQSVTFQLINRTTNAVLHSFVMPANGRGVGSYLHLEAAAGQTVSIDAQFIDNVYIRDGKVIYRNAGDHSHLTIEVICPPNTPFPHPTHQGTLDLVNGSFVANTTGSGEYMTVGMEIKLFRFVNCMHLVGDDNDEINSPEPFLFAPLYKLRFTLAADANISGSVKASILIGMFRFKTL